MVGKLRAVAQMRDEIDPSFVVCARCDAIGAEGSDEADALARCLAYAEDGRADMIWFNSAKSLDQLRQVCNASPVPVMTIWGGPPPGPDFTELAQTLFTVVATTLSGRPAWMAHCQAGFWPRLAWRTLPK